MLIDRLEQLIAKIERARQSFYPPGWKYDPMYWIHQELQSIVEEAKKRL